MADSHDDDEGGSEGDRAKNWPERLDSVLPLLTFLVEREDTSSLAAILATVLILRALAGFLGG